MGVLDALGIHIGGSSGNESAATPPGYYVMSPDYMPDQEDDSGWFGGWFDDPFGVAAAREDAIGFGGDILETIKAWMSTATDVAPYAVAAVIAGVVGLVVLVIGATLIVLKIL